MIEEAASIFPSRMATSATQVLCTQTYSRVTRFVSSCFGTYTRHTSCCSFFGTSLQCSRQNISRGGTRRSQSDA